MDTGQIVNYIHDIRARLTSKCSLLMKSLHSASSRSSPRAKTGRSASRSPSAARSPSRSFPALFFAGVGIFAGASIFHMWHLSSLFENDRFFSHLSQLEREMTFRTEQGLYYSFYKRIVEAPSFFSGVMEIMHDTSTEFPNEVNFINRFNLYPEMFLAGIYRIYATITEFLDITTVQCFRVNRGAGHSPVTACVGLGDPFYLYLLGVFGLNGLLLGVLFLTGWLLSENIGGGVITLLCFLFNHGEATRVMWTPPLRESFGYPFFVMEMLAVAYLLKTGCRSWQMSALVGVTSGLFILQWQFAPFVLLTQIGVLLFLFIACYLDYSLLRAIVQGLFYSLMACYFLLCCNSFLLTSAYGIIVIALFLLMEFFAVRKVPLAERFGYMTGWQMAGFIACVLLVPVWKMAVGGADDAHIWQIVRAKFTSWKNFHTMLYMCAPEFDFLGVEVVGKLCRTLLLPIGVMVCCTVKFLVTRELLTDCSCKCHPRKACLHVAHGERRVGTPNPSVLYDTPVCSARRSHMGYFLYRTPKRAQSNGKPGENGQPVSAVSLDVHYILLQGYAFTALALLIMRLKLLWTPQLCIVASLVASRSIFGFLRRSWHLGMVVGLMSCMLPVGMHNLREQHKIMGEYSNYPLEDILTWINNNTVEDAVFAGPMATMANLHLSTGRPIVNHPHYENAEIRERTLKVYSMYSRKSPREVHRIHRQLGVDYVVFENSYCWRKHKAGCAMPEMWDVEEPARAEYEACCWRVAADPYPFTWMYGNDVYEILKV
ncbi:probable C-mannosyltransferase DPY19L1 [Paramacrobiotus metropolitanus]|uniref:probable C-mannosyltransferase DPY19L1 n=1 Tax=Paramacrobiotus metropolitanus TaxID=2943436 RepID=UPI0024456F11|nr:probable C-mannosyltransferase DPY19L1 [Paramacrobiotus metropolitanus]